MIIETFGPPGSGKTTFNLALAERLRQRGYIVDLVLWIPEIRSRLLSFGGIIPAIIRVMDAIRCTIAVLCRPNSNAQGLQLARELLGMMPPKNIIWRIRLSQYITRFSCEWSSPHQPDRIVIFDQGFVQVACTLATFSEADKNTIARVIGTRTLPDLLIRFDAPEELLRKRLAERVSRKRFMERWFDPQVDTFLKFKPVADYIASLIKGKGDPMFSFESFDQARLDAAVDLIEREIATRQNGEHAGVEPSGAAPATAASEDTSPAAHDQSEPFITRSERDATEGLAHASALAFLIYVGGAGVTCLAQLVIARLIGATSYGIYSYTLAWVTLLSYGATLGFSTVLLRYVPTYVATGQWPLAQGVIRFAFSRTTFVATVIAIGGIATSVGLAHRFSEELTTSMLIGMAAVPLVTAYLVASAAARALGGVVSAVAPERLYRDGILIVLVALAEFVTVGPIDATETMAALLLSSAATTCIVGISLRKLRPPKLRAASPIHAPADWWNLALPAMIMIGVEVLMSRTGVLLLGWSGNARAAGIFALGLNLALFLILPRVAVGTFFAPNVSRLHAHRDHHGLQRLFARATVLSLAGTTALAIPLLVLTVPLLRFFGEEFVAAAPIAQVLAIGQIFASATGPQQNLLTMTGHERAAAAIMLFSAAINIVGCSIGIALFGAMGAAVMTAATNVLFNIAMAIYIHSRVEVTAGLVFAVAKSLRPAAVK